MIVQGQFFITVPEVTIDNNYPIKTIKYGVGGSCLDLDLRDLDFVDGATGANANEKAQNLADLINFDSENASVVFLRVNKSLTATVVNNIVTINVLIDDSCCESEGYISHLGDEEPISKGDGLPFIGAASNMQCYPIVPTLEENCASYPDRRHIFRFRFLPQTGFVFGLTGTDYRYVIESSASTPVDCKQAVSVQQYESGLSTLFYDTPTDFYNGWASTANLFWLNNYNGTITHLGDGVMEVVTDIDVWNNRLPDICSIGMYVQCVYVGEVISPAFDIEDIGQFCCIEPPYVPPPDPTIDPPKDISEEIYQDGNCDNYTMFDCCEYGLAGIKRIMFQDRKHFVKVCLDAFGIINTIETESSVWFEPCLNKTTTLTADLQNNENGYKWLHTLDCSVNVMTHLNRAMLQDLLYKKLIIIIIDNNDRAWFMGEDFPAKITTMRSTTGGESTNHFFTLVSESRHHVRGVKSDFVETITPNVNVDCSIYIGTPLEPYFLWQLKDCFLYDMRDNYLA